VTHPISFVTVALVAAAISATGHRACAQSTGVVTATVTDSLAAKPLVGARVTIRCPGCYGRWTTDSAGKFTRTGLPPGKFVIEFHCASATLLGAEILHQDVTISPNTETVVDVRVPPGQCNEPAYSERTGVFRGYWTTGFEENSFTPCADTSLGISAPLLPGKRLRLATAWADVSSSAWPQSLKEPENAPVDQSGNPRVFVTWHGVLKGPGTYGHMGVSEFSMAVDRVIDISVKGPADCRIR
jgi:hypothetical protein